MKKERSGKLFDAVGMIGDDLIEEASAYDPKLERAKKFRRYSAVAASFILVAAIAVIAVMNINKKGEKTVPETKPIEFVQNEDASCSASDASLPEELKNVSVRASDSDGKIIPTDSGFIIKTQKDCDVETVTGHMNFSPETDYSVTKLSSKEFKVSPAAGKLFPGTVYNISFGDPENPGASYTFQTESEFFVKSVLPDDMSTDVPVNTGIEITFSDGVGSADLSEFISVEPEVALDFKVYPNGRVVAAVPSEELEYGTVYTVTVKAGVSSLSGKELAKDSKTSFMTEAAERDDRSGAEIYIYTSKISQNRAPSYRYSTNSNEYIYSPDEEAAISFNVNYYELRSAKVEATLYRYPSAKDAADAVYACVSRSGADKEYALSSEGLVKVGDFEATDQDSDEYSSDGVVSFGSGLEKGFYLAELRASAKNRFGDNLNCVKYIVVQISDLRAFTISSDGKTLLRVDSRAGGAVDGAEVSSVSFNRPAWFTDEEVDTSAVVSDSASTENGVCTLNTGEANSAVITISSGEDSIVICAVCSETEDGEFGMSHLYTDREKYFSDDTVNFSGFAVNLSGKRYGALYVKTAESPAKQIEVSKNGYFRGSYSIEDHSAGGIFLSVVDGDDNIVASKYIRVTEEEKPKITASLSFDKLFYRFGETVTVTLKATFFDGTPAEGFDFTLNERPLFGSEQYVEMTTDKNGEIVYSFEAGIVQDPWSTDPSRITVDAELTGLESQTLYISKSVWYFHSDYVFKTVWETSRRAVTLNKVDTSSIKTEDDLRYDVFPENTVGEPADGSISYILKKYEIIKTETTEYDYAAKRTYKQYRYDTVESVVDSGTLTFESGVIELPMKKVEGFVGGYWYEIKYNDGRNTYRSYISATDTEYYYSGNDEDYEIRLDREKYGAGEDFTAEFYMNGSRLDGVLFAVYADGLEQYGLGSSYTDTVRGAMITGSVVYAAIFDRDSGEYLYEETSIPFDPQGNRLDITITPDKETYAPGETATVKIKVEGAPNASLTLSVVDEACFALEEQDEDSLSDYFKSVKKISKNGESPVLYGRGWYYPWYGYGASVMKNVIVNRRLTVSETDTGTKGLNYRNGAADGDYFMAADEAAAETEAPTESEPSPDPGDSSGGEEVYVRKYFADNPVFEVASLDENGEATVVFKVPDNITSWRLTAVAADGTGGDYDKVRLGNAVSDIICTQGFFINLSAPAYYIVGDDAALLARSFGVSSTGAVEYTAEVADDAGSVIATASASDDSKGYAELNFGKLEEGHYTATVYAKGESSSDALTSEFDVIKSAEMMPERRTVSVDKIKDISPALYPITLTFYDGDAAHFLYGSIVSELSWGDSSARSDMLAAKYAALRASGRVFGADESDRIASVKSSFEDYCHGLISLLTYSEGDEELTAGILTVAPDLLTSDQKSEIRGYLEHRVMSSSQPDEVTLCASLSALAAMNEPILDVLYKTAQVAGDFPDDAKLYLATAFASLGDWSAADSIYSQIRAARGEEKAEYGTLCFRGDNDDETVRLSSLALLVSSRISKKDAEMTARYLDENRSKSEPVYLALAAYVRYFMPDGEYAEKSFTYRIGDKEYSEKVTPWNMVTVKLSKSSHTSFEVISADDGIAVDASYLAVASEVLSDYDVSGRVTITKNIEPYINGMYKVTLTVKGTSTRIYESFDITDVVPAGARYFSSYSDYDYSGTAGGIHTSAYVFNTAGQKISGHVWIYNSIYEDKDVYKTECPEYSFSVTASYVIRGAVKGEFVAEPAVVRNLGANVYSASERHTVTITDGEWIINKEN